MLCDRCKKRPAKIFFTEIVAGEKKEQCLCEECAAKESAFQMQKLPNMMGGSIGGFLTSLLSSYYESNTAGEGSGGMHNRCKTCGISYEDVLKYGKFGCANCYREFCMMADQSLNQIQGAVKHTGKRPRRQKQVLETDSEAKEQKASWAAEKPNGMYAPDGIKASDAGSAPNAAKAGEESPAAQSAGEITAKPGKDASHAKDAQENLKDRMGRLSGELKEAVLEEDFERAARLRDEIRELKGEDICQDGLKNEENTPTL